MLKENNGEISYENWGISLSCLVDSSDDYNYKLS